MRERILTALVITAALALFIGCGGQQKAVGSPDVAGEPAKQEEKAPAAAAAPAPTEAAAPAPTFGAAEPAPAAPGEQVVSQDVKPETIGAPAEPAAAAPKAAAVPAAAVALPEFVDIHFDFDKYDIKPDDHGTLNKLADFLIKTEALVMVEGHCDERGTNEYNLALGDRRSKSTRDYLMARGVPSRKLKTSSFGEEKPLCAGHEESCWWQNRRSHFVINTK